MTRINCGDQHLVSVRQGRQRRLKFRSVPKIGGIHRFIARLNAVNILWIGVRKLLMILRLGNWGDYFISCLLGGLYHPQKNNLMWSQLSTGCK